MSEHMLDRIEDALLAVLVALLFVTIACQAGLAIGHHQIRHDAHQEQPTR